MIHWAWLLLAFVVGMLLGELGSKTSGKGFLIGIVGTLLALIMIG